MPADAAKNAGTNAAGSRRKKRPKALWKKLYPFSRNDKRNATDHNAMYEEVVADCGPHETGSTSMKSGRRGPPPTPSTPPIPTAAAAASRPPTQTGPSVASTAGSHLLPPRHGNQSADELHSHFKKQTLSLPTPINFSRAVSTTAVSSRYVAGKLGNPTFSAASTVDSTTIGGFSSSYGTQSGSLARGAIGEGGGCEENDTSSHYSHFESCASHGWPNTPPPGTGRQPQRSDIDSITEEFNRHQSIDSQRRPQSTKTAVTGADAAIALARTASHQHQHRNAAQDTTPANPSTPGAAPNSRNSYANAHIVSPSELDEAGAILPSTPGGYGGSASDERGYPSLSNHDLSFLTPDSAAESVQKESEYHVEKDDDGESTPSTPTTECETPQGSREGDHAYDQDPTRGVKVVIDDDESPQPPPETQRKSDPEFFMDTKAQHRQGQEPGARQQQHRRNNSGPRGGVGGKDARARARAGINNDDYESGFSAAPDHPYAEIAVRRQKSKSIASRQGSGVASLAMTSISSLTGRSSLFNMSEFDDHHHRRDDNKYTFYHNGEGGAVRARSEGTKDGAVSGCTTVFNKVSEVISDITRSTCRCFEGPDADATGGSVVAGTSTSGTAKNADTYMNTTQAMASAGTRASRQKGTRESESVGSASEEEEDDDEEGSFVDRAPPQYSSPLEN